MSFSILGNVKACSFIPNGFAFPGHFSVPWFFYSGQEHVHLHKPAQLPELCQSGNLIPLLCFFERLAKITLLQISFGLLRYMISIHAIQFLVETINWTSPLLAMSRKGGGEKMLISSHRWKTLKKIFENSLLVIVTTMWRLGFKVRTC